MERKYIAENKKGRDRLRKLVNEITDEELSLIIYKEGWTIAVALAHLAFYDERRRVLLRKWKIKGSDYMLLPTKISNDLILWACPECGCVYYERW